jgi:hypothetical protein
MSSVRIFRTDKSWQSKRQSAICHPAIAGTYHNDTKVR